MPDVETLQGKLEERAKQKFIKGLSIFKEALEQSGIERGLINEIRVGYNLGDKKIDREFYWAVGHCSEFRLRLWELHKEKLIKKEVEDFLNKMDDLQVDIDILKNINY